MSEILELLTAGFETALSASIVALPVIAIVFLVDLVLGQRLRCSGAWWFAD